MLCLEVRHHSNTHAFLPRESLFPQTEMIKSNLSVSKVKTFFVKQANDITKLNIQLTHLVIEHKVSISTGSSFELK